MECRRGAGEPAAEEETLVGPAVNGQRSTGSHDGIVAVTAPLETASVLQAVARLDAQPPSAQVEELRALVTQWRAACETKRGNVQRASLKSLARTIGIVIPNSICNNNAKISEAIADHV